MVQRACSSPSRSPRAIAEGPWKKPPHFNGCAPWISCACAGVEWGVKGELELGRERPGDPVERLDLGALREGGAEIPGFVRRPFDEGRYDARGKLLQEGQPLAEVVKRPHAEVLKLRDYDHDGRATELVFETGYTMCGQNPSVLVGVSKAEPHLHVLGTAEEPRHPLEMPYLSAWDQILAARGPTLEVALQECGDHGGPGYYLTLRLDPVAGFHIAEASAWACDFAYTPPRRTVRLPPEAP